jgi:hypothetical protein
VSAIAQEQTRGFNLLRIRPIRNLILWRGFPFVFQAALLLGFLSLIMLGWGRFAPAGVNEKLFAKTNLVTLLVWGLWWPTMIWIAVLLGRPWCLICPLELVSNLSERLGRRIGIKQRHLYHWLISGTVIVALYALTQLLVAGAHIHRIPAYTALFLVGLLALALGTGLVFKDRAFCRGFCPVGQLLAVYGRGGMLAVRAEAAQTCASCTGKDCLVTRNRARLDARSCPSLLNPPHLNSNQDCLVCLQCIKACQPDNMTLLLRSPFHPADARVPLATWPTTVFIMLVSGFVTWELFTEWPAAEKLFLAVPQWVSQQLQMPWLSGYFAGLWALVLVPLIIWSLMGLLVRLLDSDISLSLAWRRLALPVAVIVSAGHMAKGLAKLSSWLGFLPYAASDVAGIETVQAITNKALPTPTPLLPLAIVAVIGVILLSVGLFFALRETKLSHQQAYRAYLLPQFILAVGFVLIVCGWAFK